MQPIKLRLSVVSDLLRLRSSCSGCLPSLLEPLLLVITYNQGARALQYFFEF